MADPSPAADDLGDTSSLTRWLQWLPGSPRLGALTVLTAAVVGCALAWSYLPRQSTADLEDDGFEELSGVDESLAELGEAQPMADSSENPGELLLPAPTSMSQSEELVIPAVQSAAFTTATSSVEQAPAWLEGRIESVDEPMFITPYRRGEHIRTSEQSGPVLLKR